MNTKPFILVAEDDAAISTGLAMNLELEGYRSEVALDGELAAERIQSEDPPDLVLLDIGMPRKDGLELLTELRQAGNRTPIIILSARLSESDKVAALRMGADDYITKPFALAELMARVDAVLRRSSSADSAAGATETARDKQWGYADVSVDMDRRLVHKAGHEVQLTHLEFELLSFFLSHPHQVLERNRLLREVWGTSGSRRTVDNFVGQLRSKLETDPESPEHFLTVRGSGYRFEPGE
jgi:DNA-binding response OmpR family regulator